MNMQKKFTHVESPVELAEFRSFTDESGTRFYESPGGKYPSVTTVTGFEKRAFFAEWRRNNPEESKRVLRRGNQLHELIEDYLSNNNLPKYDASDMLHAHHIGEIELLDFQIGWFNNFIRLWDFVSEAQN